MEKNRARSGKRTKPGLASFLSGVRGNYSLSADARTAGAFPRGFFLMKLKIMDDLYEDLKQRLLRSINGSDLLAGRVQVKARGLTVEEAIGNPEADDFPLQKGKEKLMQADFRGASGQAFTDQYGDFEGTLDHVLEMRPDSNYRRAIFIATLNAVLRHVKLIEKTVHCRDQEPALCAAELCSHLKAKYGRIKIAQVGFQPRIVEALGTAFELRVVDMDPDNIGATRFNTCIEDPDVTEEFVNWADLLLVTGTTLVNGTIGQFITDKPTLFYGTTIAGAASLMGWNRFCACGK